VAGTEEHNEREIEALERLIRREMTRFYVLVALIPLSLVALCCPGVLMYRSFPNAGAVVGLAGLILPVVALASMLFRVKHRGEYQRALAVAHFAQDRGLRYTYDAPTDRVEFFAAFLFKRPRLPNTGQGLNLLEGRYKKRAVVAADYSFVHMLTLRHHRVSQQTAVAFTEGFAGLPDFAVLPLSWAELWRNAILDLYGETYKVPDEKEFNRHFVVTGEQRKAILARLTPDVIDLLLDDPRRSLEVRGGVLLVYRQEVLLPADAYERFLSEADRLARVLGR
jgi:hypothetical protein